jgi:type VI secretion system protein ImpK
MSSTMSPAGGMTAPAAGAADLELVQFRAFYAELMRARDVALAAGEAEAESVARALSKQLAQLIELQSLETRRLGGRVAGVDEGQARFLKAALADELMLHLDWAGRSAWRHFLLEATLFRTSLAGDRVFDEIDRILSAREASDRRIAQLYLHVLSLGFKGRHRDARGEELIAECRNELFQFVYQRAPGLQGQDRVLSSQAYASTLSHLAATRVRRLSRWSILLALALVTLLGISELLWLWQSWPVRRLLDAPVTVSHASLAGDAMAVERRSC